MENLNINDIEILINIVKTCLIGNKKVIEMVKDVLKNSEGDFKKAPRQHLDYLAQDEEIFLKRLEELEIRKKELTEPLYRLRLVLKGVLQDKAIGNDLSAVNLSTAPKFTKKEANKLQDRYNFLDYCFDDIDNFVILEEVKENEKI